MKIAVLTSSRADFGIYLPLLQRVQDDDFFQLEIIAFGTHLSKYHGYTIDQIEEAGFKNLHKIASLLTNDEEASIATAYGLTALKFSDFWKENQFDYVFCLGDRFEMAAAVNAGIPFGVKFVHIHGGETTLGAIDNIYRHQITLASNLHFPATDEFAARIAQINGSTANIYPVGSLSINELDNLVVPSEKDFRERYQIRGEFALLTFHPETISPAMNEKYAREMDEALLAISEEIVLVITMPNADTNGSIFRNALLKLKEKKSDKIILIENFGKLNYFAAMSYCRMLIGNTSSGIIEAASFRKYVINVGDRQKGRTQSDNIINVPFNGPKILKAFFDVLERGDYDGINMYYKPNTVDLIITNLKNHLR